MRRLPLLLLLLPLACAGISAPSSTTPKKKRPAAPASTAASRAADAQAQQRAYDRGLAAYGKEDYPAARKAFAEAVRLGPETPLGKKAKDNLDKVDSILKNLKELERQ